MALLSEIERMVQDLGERVSRIERQLRSIDQGGVSSSSSDGQASVEALRNELNQAFMRIQELTRGLDQVMASNASPVIISENPQIDIQDVAGQVLSLISPQVASQVEELANRVVPPPSNSRDALAKELKRMVEDGEFDNLVDQVYQEVGYEDMIAKLAEIIAKKFTENEKDKKSLLNDIAQTIAGDPDTIDTSNIEQQVVDNLTERLQVVVSFPKS